MALSVPAKSWSRFFVLHSAFHSAVGAVALFKPNNLFGKTSEVSGYLGGRLVGSAFQMFALLSWRVRRRLHDRSAHDAAVALCLYHILDALSVLKTLFGGELVISRWKVRPLAIAVFIHAAFAYGFYRFLTEHPVTNQYRYESE